MALPKQKKTKSKTRMRRAKNDKVVLTKIVTCPNCGEFKRPHFICPNCGYYRDEEIISTEEE